MLGWGRDQDCSKGTETQLLKKLLNAKVPTGGARMCIQFARKIRNGDIVVANRGADESIAIGIRG